MRPAPGTPDRYAAVGFYKARVAYAHMLMFPFCWMLAFLLEPCKWRLRIALVIGLGLVLGEL